MTEKTIIKKIIITILLLVALVAGYIFSKPYLPSIKEKYDQFRQAISQVISNEPSTTSENSQGSESEASTLESMTNQNEESNESSSQEVTELSQTTSEENQTTSEILTKFKLEDYLNMSYTGKTGQGQAKAKLNMDKLLEEIRSKSSNQISKAELEQAKFEVTPHLTLSNNDEIEVTLVADQKIMDLFEATTVKQVVTGLKKALSFSSQQLKSGLDLEFVGYSGLAKVDIKSNFTGAFENLEVINLNPDENLKNGDKITIELTEASKLYLEEQGYDIEDNGQVEYLVSGLEEPFLVEQELINKHVVVNFVGTSGAGQARIDTTFQPPLAEYLIPDAFEVTNNGQIINGETVTISIKEEVVSKMKDKGIVVDDNAKIERKADKMLEVALSFKDLKDWKTIIGKIDEKIKQKYPDTLFGSYDIKAERYYYRPFHTANDLLKLENVTQDGTIIGVYTVTTYDREKKQVRNTETEIFGFTDLFVNKEMTVDMDKLIEYHHKYDNTYSLESVFQILEGYNFKAVNLKE